MNWPQKTAAHPLSDSLAPQTQRQELTAGDNPMLVLGKLSHLAIPSQSNCSFDSHYESKAQVGEIRPLVLPFGHEKEAPARRCRLWL